MTQSVKTPPQHRPQETGSLEAVDDKSAAKVEAALSYDPFKTFSEWASEADQRAYSTL